MLNLAQKKILTPLTIRLLVALLCTLVLVTSLGIDARPTVAGVNPPTNPYIKANFSFYVIFPDLYIWGTGFPRDDILKVRIKADNGTFYKLDELIKVGDDGAFEERLLLPAELNKVDAKYTICLKSQRTGYKVCRTGDDWAIFETKRCYPTTKEGRFDWKFEVE